MCISRNEIKTGVNSVKHFHCSGKNEKHTDELQNMSCAISVIRHTQSMLLNLCWRPCVSKIKMSSKICANKFDFNFSSLEMISRKLEKPIRGNRLQKKRRCFVAPLTAFLCDFWTSFLYFDFELSPADYEVLVLIMHQTGPFEVQKSTISFRMSPP